MSDLMPPGSLDVTISKFLPHYAVMVIDGKLVAGSHAAMAYAAFRENKRVRPRLRGLRNPSRSVMRTDFGWRIERAAANARRGVFQAKGEIREGALVALNRDGTVSEARG